MSQAEAYLNSLTDDVPRHDHTVTDSDSRFVIDPETRKISSTGQTENVLIQYDHNSEVYTFELPRYIEGHDMALCNRVRVHFNNVDGKTNRAIPDVSEMTDLHVSETDPDKVVSSWIISRNATQLAGTLNFLIQYMCVDDEDTVVYEWHTDIYDGVHVNSGRRNSKQTVSRYSDVLEQWYQRLFGTGESVIALAEEKIEEITAEATAQINFAKEEITSKASAALDSIPSEYTDLYDYANEAARTKGDAVTHTVEGEVISVSDSSDDYLRGLQVFGKTTQVKTGGKNLLNNTAETGSINGIYYSVHKDGSVMVNGTATDDSFLTIGSISYIGGVTYKISGCPSNGSNNTYMLYAVYGTNIYAFDTGEGITFTPETDMVKTVSIKIVKGATVKNLVFYPMVRYASVVDSTYEPYSGGVASPSPEWPQELTSIENPKVEFVNKNLVDFSAHSNAANYAALIDVFDLSKIKKGKTYTISAWLDSEVDSRAYWNNATKVFEYLEFEVSAGLHRYTYTFTAVEDGIIHANPVNVMNKYPTNDDKRITASKVQIEEGYNATEYVQFDSQSISITRTLPGIPVDQNGNYTDVDGQQWICDEVDFERGVYVQRIGVKTINGSIAPTTFTEGNKGGTVLGWQYDGIGMANIARDRSPKLCDKLLAPDVLEPASYKNCEYGRWGFNTNKSADSFLLMNVGTFTTANEAKQWFAENPVTFYYILATPIETPLTETELQTFKYIHSNYPSTTAFNDSGAWMELKYNVDTELFIKNTVPRPSDEQVNNIVMPWFEDNKDILRGPQGPKGDTGATGATGPQGPKGADGTMTFSDLTQEQKDSLKGDPGERGLQGPAGADGKSAYAYAQDGGYTGTESEFAEELANVSSVANDANNKVDTLAEELANVSSVANDANNKVDTLREVVSKLHSNIVEEASGEVITISDSAEAPIHGLKVYGKTKQFTTTGKNLLAYPYALTSKKTVNGIDWTPNTDGSVTANGTLSGSNSYVALSTYSNNRITLPAGTYRASSGCDDIIISVSVYTKNDGSEYAEIGKGSVADFTIESSTIMRIYLSTTSSSLNTIVYPMIRLVSVTDATYEPYTGGIPSPNPDYPQTLDSVINDGSVDVTACGKNLLKPTSAGITTNGITYSRNADMSMTVNGTCVDDVAYCRYSNMKLPAGTYVLSGAPSGTIMGRFDMYLTGRRLSDDSSLGTIARGADDTTLTQFTLTEECSISLMLRVVVGQTIENKIFYPMIRLASIVDSTYEPYISGTMTISAPYDLPGIPVTSGGNYTDSNGQQWICDEIDFENGVYIQRVGQITYDGSQTWTNLSESRFYLDVSDGNTTIANALCSKYKRHTGSLSSMVDKTFYMSLSSSTGKRVLYVKDSNYTDKAELATALTASPMDFQYILKTPIETALSAEQLAAFAELHTYYPNSTIYNDVGADMDVTYVVDTKMYIDKKFAELATAIINNT